MTGTASDVMVLSYLVSNQCFIYLFTVLVGIKIMEDGNFCHKHCLHGLNFDSDSCDEVTIGFTFRFDLCFVSLNLPSLIVHFLFHVF